MTTPGCKFSGTDKGGYKFYFTAEDGDHGKFYGEHLEDLTREELVAWAEVARRVLGVDWEFVKGGPPKCWMPKSASFYGWQVWGTVDADGKPVFDESSPVPPSEEWWAKQQRKDGDS